LFRDLRRKMLTRGSFVKKLHGSHRQ